VISGVLQLLGRYFKGWGRSASRDALRQHPVARPIPTSRCFQDFSWASESILILGQEKSFFALAKSLSDMGATVSFRFLVNLQQLYQLPLEQYTIAIMVDGDADQQFDVIDVGGILKRADAGLSLFWASEQFKMSSISDTVTDRFCDVLLALPSSPEALENFLRPSNQRPSRTRVC